MNTKYTLVPEMVWSLLFNWLLMSIENAFEDLFSFSLLKDCLKKQIFICFFFQWCPKRADTSAIIIQLRIPKHAPCLSNFKDDLNYNKLLSRQHILFSFKRKSPICTKQMNVVRFVKTSYQLCTCTPHYKIIQVILFIFL